MEFSFQRQLRLAGSVAAIVGVVISNWHVVVLGWTVVAIGYMVSMNKIEKYIEAQEPKSKEEAEDALR